MELHAGETLMRRGRKALTQESLSGLIAADIEFHQFVASLTRNRTLEEVTSVVLRNVRRAMGEIIVLSGYDLSWGEHAAILAAIANGDPDGAERLAREHAERGRRVVIDAYAGAVPGPGADPRPGTSRDQTR